MNGIDIRILLTILLVGGVLLYVGAVAWQEWQRKQSAENAITDIARLMSTAPIGIMLVAPDLSLRFANRYARQLLQFDEATTPAWRDTLRDDLRPDAEAGYRLVNWSGRQTLGWWHTPLTDGRLVLVQDMSQQRQRDRQHQQLWGGVSHELRTPLTSLIAHLDVVRSADVPPEIAQHSLTIMHQQTHRLARLVQNVLDLGRLQANTTLERTAIDIVLVAEEAVSEIYLLIEEHEMLLTFNASPYLPAVFGNRDRIKQVFTNLIDNAVKYGRKGNEITLTLTERPNGIHCAVSDDGQGVAAHHLPRLRQQFYQAHRQSSGSGLGLAIVDEIVRQHESELVLDSAEGQGFTASFTLPFAPKTDVV